MMDNKFTISQWFTGKWSRWVTLLAWVAVAGLLNVLLPSVNSQEKNNAPNLSDSKPSVIAESIANLEFPAGADVPALLVWHREGGLLDSDLSLLQELSYRLTESPVIHQTNVPPLHLVPLEGLKSQLSKDGSTLVTPVFFDKNVDVEQLKTGTEQLQEEVRELFGADPFAVSTDHPEELSARITGPVGIQIDATGLFQNADVTLLIATVLLVLFLLLLIYRSPILALLPLVGVGFAYSVIGPVLGWMAHEEWITLDSQGISIMTVLLFGAGTDYCLFLIARFRHLLRTEGGKVRALRSAFSGAAGAIAMSGLTVVISMLALFTAEYGAFHRFAVPFSIAILIMIIASLTLVPALLAIIGRTSFWPFIPRTNEEREQLMKRKGEPVKIRRVSGPRYRIGAVVVKRPVFIIIVSTILLGTLAAFATQIRYTYDILSSFPKDMASREGFQLIGEQFSEGELAPLQLIVDTQGKPTTLAEDVKQLPYVTDVSEPRNGRVNAEILAYEVTLNLNPYSIEAMNHVPDLRVVAERSLSMAGVDDAGTRVWIGGQTAEQYDTKITGDRDTRVIIPIVIGMIALLLLIYLRSIVATLYLVLTVILSYFSALGLGWLVLHYGFGAEAIQGAIPLYAFVFIVALGEDYNIFMISSIWQKRRTMPLKQAIRDGVGETGSVITSAGLILAGTFAVLATLPIQVLVQFGTVTAIGVLLDTFIVRPFLVPAITMVLGRWSFWPSKFKDVAERANG